MSQSLAATLRGFDEEESWRIRIATVTNDTVPRVTFADGNEVDASRCVGYTPVNGHIIIGFQSDTDFIIFDRVISSG